MTDIENSRQHLTWLVGVHLQLVADMPAAHQQGRDYAQQHGGFKQPVADIGTACEAGYYDNGSLAWKFKLNSLTRGEVIITEHDRGWEIRQNGTAVANSVHPGSALQPDHLALVVSEVEVYLRKYADEWLTVPTPAPAPQPAPATLPPVITTTQVANQIRRRKGILPGIFAILAALLSTITGWGIGPILLITAVGLSIWQLRKSGIRSPLVIAAFVVSALCSIVVVWHVISFINELMTVLNDPTTI